MTCANKYVTLFFIFFHNNNNKFDMCLTNISHYFSFCSFLFTSPRKKYNFFYMFHVTRFSILFIIKRWCVTSSYFYYILTFYTFYYFTPSTLISIKRDACTLYETPKRKVNHPPMNTIFLILWIDWLWYHVWIL